MKFRRLFAFLMGIVVIILAVFAARSIMRPEKFKTVYQLRKEANVQNLLAIRSAQAVYKNVNKSYASNIDDLFDFVKNGTVQIEKNVGNFPDTMSEAEAFKLGLIHKEIVNVPAIEKILDIDHNLTVDNFKHFQYIPFSNKENKYSIQVDSLSSKTYTIPVYKIEVSLDEMLVNMGKSITPEDAGFFSKLWNKIFYNDLAEENQYRTQYDGLTMGSLTEASTAGSWE